MESTNVERRSQHKDETESSSESFSLHRPYSSSPKMYQAADTSIFLGTNSTGSEECYRYPNGPYWYEVMSSLRKRKKAKRQVAAPILALSSREKKTKSFKTNKVSKKIEKSKSTFRVVRPKNFNWQLSIIIFTYYP